MQQTERSTVTLGERLREYREKKEMSQEELAQRLHLTRQTISGWECGRCQPDITCVQKLSEVYEVSIDEMLHNVDSDKKKPSRWRWLFLAAACVLLVFAFVQLLPVLAGTAPALHGSGLGSISVTLYDSGFDYFACNVLPLLNLGLSALLGFWLVRTQAGRRRRKCLAAAAILVLAAAVYLVPATWNAHQVQMYLGVLLNPGFWVPLLAGVFLALEYKWQCETLARK